MSDGAYSPAFAPAVLTVDLDALAENYRILRRTAAPAAVAAVVKADAYGLGLEPAVRALAAAGCRRFFTAHLDKAIAARRIVPDQAVEVGVLNGLFAGEEAAYAEHALIPTLNDLGQVDLWAAFCGAQGPRPAALQVDTGMARLGLPPAETRRLIDDPARLSRFPVRYLISHLACADRPDHPLNREQRNAFAEAAAALPHEIATLANSSGIFLGSDWRFDMVRAGYALYGGRPNSQQANPMRPVVRLTAKILQIRDVDAPQTVGYGAAHRIEAPARVATVGAGYADGYLRSLSGRGTGYLNGVAAPLIGRVSMDLLTFDVTGHPDAKVGDWIELIGAHVTIDDLADAAGTIGYEILTALGARFERRYFGGGALAEAGAAE